MKFKRVVLKLSNNSFSTHNNIDEISEKVKRKRKKERKEREKTS
jgi:hypothetical protein